MLCLLVLLREYARLLFNGNAYRGASQGKEMTDQYRIEDKQNVNRNGKVTLFKLYERDGDAYVFSGQYVAPGYNASDAKCIAAFERIESATDFAW